MEDQCYEILFTSEIYEKFNDKMATISELKNSYKSIPNESGIYFVIKPKDFKVEIMEKTTAITEYKNKSMLFDKNQLVKKFEKSNKIILYIGKADGKKNTLQKRIRQLIEYSYGKAKNHRGGRALWQIKDNKDLLLIYFENTNARNLEKELLKEYKRRFGELPLANWRI